MIALPALKEDHGNGGQVHLRVGLQKGVDQGEGAGRQQVVRVHEIDVLAPGQGQAGVAGGGDPAVFLVDHGDVLREAGRVFVTDGAAAVRGAVVHQNQLDAGKAEVLADQAVDGLPDIGKDLVHGHDDREDEGRLLRIHIRRLLCVRALARRAWEIDGGCYHKAGPAPATRSPDRRGGENGILRLGGAFPAGERRSVYGSPARSRIFS